MSRTKYILVERADHHPVAVSRLVVDDMVKRQEPIIKAEFVTKARIKKERIRIYDDESYFKHMLWQDFRDAHHGKTFTATVDYFDNMRGEGMVTLSTGHRLALYACNIKGRKTWYPETACVYYTKGQVVEIEVECSFGGKVFAKGLTAGILDVEGWNNIKNKPLAFKCDDEGNAINGLFG